MAAGSGLPSHYSAFHYTTPIIVTQTMGSGHCSEHISSQNGGDLLHGQSSILLNKHGGSFSGVKR